jgi:RNA polymerase sigma factor (sigma-70 family)
MKRACAAAVARGLESLVDPGTVTGLSEAQVLARFVERGDPVAFEAIVVRYGPMVLSVCRQMLRDSNDVDDAFQATFLILVQKAGGLRQPDRLGPWLYGVAHRVASRSRRRRRRAEGLPRDVAAPGTDHDPDQMAALHDEIGRLPEKYRLPIVLCCVDEETHDEAARKLGWPVGTVHGRLSRARDVLRARLSRRGMVIPEMISRPAGSASKRREKAVPEPLLRSTVGLSTGAIPTQLHHLVKGALAAMFIEKLKSTGLVVAVTTLGVATAATGLMAFQEPAKKAARPASVVESQGEDRPVMKKALDKASIAPSPSIAGNEADEEHAAEDRGRMQAQVELLELNSESLRSRIHQGLALIDQLGDELHADGRQGMTPEQFTEHKKSLNDRIDDKQHSIQQWEEQYSKTRVQIARLNYRIARSPRSMYEAERDDSGKTIYELLRRIDRLEAKVDRLSDSIRRGGTRP